jgi:hypothetical protein
MIFNISECLSHIFHLIVGLNFFLNFSGLTGPAMSHDRKLSEISEIGESSFAKYEEGLKEIRTSAGTRRGLARKQTPLERGWTGSNPQGRKFGKPQTPNVEMDFADFDSILIEYR